MQLSEQFTCFGVLNYGAVPTPTEKGVLIMDFDLNMILSIVILIILADIIKNIKK